MLAFQIGEKKMCRKSEQHIHERNFHVMSFRLRLRVIKWGNLKTSYDSNIA